MRRKWKPPVVEVAAPRPEDPPVRPFPYVPEYRWQPEPPKPRRQKP